jgi:hypothetical protein
MKAAAFEDTDRGLGFSLDERAHLDVRARCRPLTLEFEGKIVRHVLNTAPTERTRLSARIAGMEQEPYSQVARPSIGSMTFAWIAERRPNMMHAQTLAICAVGIVCSTHGLGGQGLSQYRSFELGSDVASVSALAGIAASETKMIHQRPAVLQDLEWRPSHWILGSTAASTDPVEQLLFSFYNDQLFRVVVTYAHERTEGMTGADITDAISVVYGTPLPRPPRGTGRVASQLEIESGTPVARWGDAAHAVVLYQTSSYGAAFRLIVTDTRLENLARKAEAQSQRLDDREAPQREVARQRKERDDGRAAAAKARTANKGVFRP